MKWLNWNRELLLRGLVLQVEVNNIRLYSSVRLGHFFGQHSCEHDVRWCQQAR